MFKNIFKRHKIARIQLKEYNFRGYSDMQKPDKTQQQVL